MPAASYDSTDDNGSQTGFHESLHIIKTPSEQVWRALWMGIDYKNNESASRFSVFFVKNRRLKIVRNSAMSAAIFTDTVTSWTRLSQANLFVLFIGAERANMAAPWRVQFRSKKLKERKGTFVEQNIDVLSMRSLRMEKSNCNFSEFWGQLAFTVGVALYSEVNGIYCRVAMSEVNEALIRQGSTSFLRLI